MGTMTGEDYVHLTNKKILGYDDLAVDFLGYLRDRDEALATNVFRRDGTFGGAKIGLAADGADKFQVTDIAEQTDGAGNLIELPTGPGLSTGIQFENALGIPYAVGIHHAERPRGIRINPRLGRPEFERYEEAVGERAVPDAVTVGGSTLTFEVTSVTEAGVSNAGRKCLVWKKTPGDYVTLESQAVEECTVFYSGGKNQITTTTLLGQALASGTASDYYVLLLGPSVRRNTDLRVTDGYAFIGGILGAGTGVAPSLFDTSDQWLIPYFSDLGDITRVHTNGHLKIQVKSYAGESDVAQVEVLNPGGSTVFRVNEVGDVVIEGDLFVQGTTTQENLVQVNSSETITDNLTAGDDDATDSHKIKGSWWHTNNAETAYHFYVDGASGRVGFGQAPHATDPFAVTGQSRFTGNVIPGTDNAYDLGSMTNRWANLYAVNIVFSGDFLPLVDNTQDIGSATFRWAELWGVTHYVADANFSLGILSSNPIIAFDAGGDAIQYDRAGDRLWFYIGGANEATLSAAGLAVSNTNSNYNPSTDNTDTLGAAGNRWASVFATAHYIQDSNFALKFSASSNPSLQFDSGEDGFHFYRSSHAVEYRATGSNRWDYGLTAANTFTVPTFTANGNATFNNPVFFNGFVYTDFTPSPTESRNLGSASLRWNSFYCASANIKYLWLSTTNGEGCVNDFRPTSDASPSLGAGSYRWRRLYLSDGATHGVFGNLVPTSDAAYNLGGTSYRWNGLYISGAVLTGSGFTTGGIYGVYYNQGSGTMFGGRSPYSAQKPLWIENYLWPGGTASGDGSIQFRTGVSGGSPALQTQLWIDENGRIWTGSSASGFDATNTGGGVTIRPTNAGTIAFSIKAPTVNTTQNSPHTDTFVRMGYWDNGYGGLRVASYANGTIGAYHNPTCTTYSTTTSTAAYGSFTIQTSVSGMPANGNAFVVRDTNQGGAAFIVKADGDLLVNSDTNTTEGVGYVNALNNAVRYFDDEQDAIACQDLAYAMAGAWNKVLSYQKPELERLGVMVNGFISYRNATALSLGAIGELRLVVDHLCKKFGLDYEELRKELRGLGPKAIEA